MAQPNRLCRGRPGKALEFIGRAGNGKGSMARWRRARPLPLDELLPDLLPN
jgi:hypothetical protein